MDLANKIILLASVLTALGVIIATAIKVYKFIRKWEKWIEEKDEHDKAQRKDILRLIIMTPEMPLSERISAGDIYVNKLNGNGGVKQKYLELLQKFSEEHKE
jgi:predicted transcriptional regulator